MGMGASAVQFGTPFAVTEEGDAHPNFKKVLVEARPEDIVTFMSVAGLPARAVRTPWLANYLEKEEKLQRIAKKVAVHGWLRLPGIYAACATASPRRASSVSIRAWRLP